MRISIPSPPSLTGRDGTPEFGRKEGVESPRSSGTSEGDASCSSISLGSMPKIETKVRDATKPPFRHLLDKRWDEEVTGLGKALHELELYKTNTVPLKEMDAALVDTGVLSSDDISWVNGPEYKTKHIPSYAKYKGLVAEMVKKMQGDPDRAVSMGLELVAKVLSYGRFHPHAKVPILALIEGKLQLVEYHPLLLDLTDGNAAYFFVPSEDASEEARPILTFRGISPQYASGSYRACFGQQSALNHFFSWSSSLEIDMGRNVILNDGHYLTKLLADAEKRFGKVLVTGYSLGGALAGRLAMNAENHHFIEKVVTFNAPGISSSDVRKFEQLVEEGSLNEGFGEAYTTEGDYIGNTFGFENFLGRKFVISPQDGKQRGAVALHGECVLGKRMKLSEVRPTHNDGNIGTLFSRTLRLPFSIAQWVASRFFWINFSILCEAYYATGLWDYTRPFRDRITKGLCLAKEADRASLSPLQEAERRSIIYHSLLPVEGESAPYKVNKWQDFVRGMLAPSHIKLKPYREQDGVAAEATGS